MIDWVFFIMISELITMSTESPAVQQDANITTTKSTSSSVVVKKDQVYLYTVEWFYKVQ